MPYLQKATNRGLTWRGLGLRKNLFGLEHMVSRRGQGLDVATQRVRFGWLHEAYGFKSLAERFDGVGRHEETDAHDQHPERE